LTGLDRLQLLANIFTQRRIDGERLCAIIGQRGLVRLKRGALYIHSLHRPDRLQRQLLLSRGQRRLSCF
jgi:hypothetical protein